MTFHGPDKATFPPPSPPGHVAVATRGSDALARRGALRATTVATAQTSADEPAAAVSLGAAQFPGLPTRLTPTQPTHAAALSAACNLPLGHSHQPDPGQLTNASTAR